MPRYEKLFELLTRKDGTPFGPDTVRRWYEARHYVLATLSRIEDGAAYAAPHVVVEGTSPLMFSVVRHLAMVAHYPSFNEAEGSPRTRITILCPGAGTLDALHDVEAVLAREEYLCNMMSAAECRYRTLPGAEPYVRQAGLPYIDIEIELVGVHDFSDYTTPRGAVRITEEDIAGCIAGVPDRQLYAIDTSKAMLANMVYAIGADLENLPEVDNTATSRYDLALNTFCFKKQRRQTIANWDSTACPHDPGKKRDLYRVKNKLSNVFCTDTFESRLRGLLSGMGDDEFRKGPQPSFLKPRRRNLWRYHNGRIDLLAYTVACKPVLMRAVADNLAVLSRCEHSRWVAEKLIMGFRQMNPEEAYLDETSFGAARAAFRNNLKRNAADPSHIDLCSYADLRRLNPSDMKYDCLLTLAMPHVVAEALTVKDNNRKTE